jgi:chemosensory pili system protein ChpA (sensor histidine kinase/response regulator)
MSAHHAPPLSWVKPEVDHALNRVRDSIASYLEKPGAKDTLNQCPGQIHQVAGALNMLGLRGVVGYCESIEMALSGVSSRPAAPKSAVTTLDRAVLALKEFIDGLARGEVNAPIKLFPMYREVATLSGNKDVSEKDLFYPDLSIDPPMHPASRVLPAEKLPAIVLAQRSQFQHGFLEMIRNPADRNGLKGMRRALEALDMISTQLPSPRSLWWASTALIDGLMLSQQPDDWTLGARSLCSKLDLRMRDIARAQAAPAADTLLRDVLYAVAKCARASVRIREVRHLYQLDALFPEPEVPGLMEFDMDWLGPALDDVRARLRAVKEHWVQYVSGSANALKSLREAVAGLKQKNGELGNVPLGRMLETITVVAARLPNPYPAGSEFMVTEMASAFLLIENIVDHYVETHPDHAQQVDIMGAWLLDAAKGDTPTSLPAGLHDDLGQEVSRNKLRSVVSKELRENLQHIEQVIDAHARGQAGVDTLIALNPLLKQVHGALNILGFDRAVEIQSMCNQLLIRTGDAGAPLTAAEMDTLVEGLSSIGFYLDPCISGLPPAEGALDIFFERLQKRRAREALAGTAAPGSAPAPAGHAAVAPIPAAAPASAETGAAAPGTRDVDPEMLGVFLEEAMDVLEKIGAATGAPPVDSGSLVTIRRGFHTLKGSGRMVGLTDLGATAWEVEQVMNRWLELQWPADAPLMDMIRDAHGLFAAWVEAIREHRAPAVDTAALLEKTRALKEAPSPLPAAAAAPSAEPAAPDTATAGDTAETIVDQPAAAINPEPEILIGSHRISRTLHALYCKEAMQHTATIAAQLESPDAVSGGAEHEALEIATHTLAGISRTAGFAQPAGIAGRLERCLPLAGNNLSPQDRALLRECAAALRRMVNAITQGNPPEAAEGIAEALDRLLARQRDVPAATEAPAPEAASPAHDIPEAPDAGADSVARGPVIEPAVAPATRQATPPLPEPVIEPLDDASLVRAVATQRAEDQRRVRDDIDTNLLPIFLEEADELLPRIGRDLRGWMAAPGDQTVMLSLQRALHTLKGSARMAGAMRLGELAHLTEARLESALQHESRDADFLDNIASHVDRIGSAVDALRAHTGPSGAVPASQDAPSPAQPAAAAVPEENPAAALRGGLQLRIHADTVERLLNDASEIGIARSRIDSEASGVRQAMSDLEDSLTRLKSQLREMEVQADSQMQSRHSVMDAGRQDYDPLEFDRYTRLQELVRLMAESLHDIMAVQQTVTRHVGGLETASTRQARINRGLQQELMRSRTVPFSNIAERLYQIARRTARDLGRKAHVEITGGHLEIDRSVLERIAAPIEHLLRNALAHGIEAPEVRVARGKDETGQVSLTLRQEGNEIAIEIADDGAGIDPEKLRERALALGLIGAGDRPERDALLSLIYHPGFSTAAEVSEISGRGIGMDVVRTEIDAVGGQIDIETRTGSGTTFRIYLPLTVAVTQAVLVRAGESVLAIPSSSVDQVLRLQPDALFAAREAGTINHRNVSWPLHDLSALLDFPDAGVEGHCTVLLLHSGQQRIALHVEALLNNQEIVVKQVNAQLARAPGVTGATVLADGRVALIINPVQLSRRSEAGVRMPAVSQKPASAAKRTVMVIDDSMTVRKITSRLLEREDYRVATAKDGIDALEQMQTFRPDILLVDIEMPRMDGFDLVRHVRADSQRSSIPIIMISSRTADKHREHARALGVNAFLGKPYQDQELLKQMKLLLGSNASN